MAASRDPFVRLGHIRDEIADLTKALDGVTFETFARSYLFRRSAEHAVLIISEAVRTLPAASTDRFPDIDWRAIRGIGNILRHAYYEVDVRVLWRIITDRLPEVDAAIKQMIEDHAS